MDVDYVPSTNNLVENDIRRIPNKAIGMLSPDRGAQIFFCIRGYVSTCRRQAMHWLV
jgi:hypothetical protein